MRATGRGSRGRNRPGRPVSRGSDRPRPSEATALLRLGRDRADDVSEMNGGDAHGNGPHIARAGRWVFLTFICLVIAPIAGLWVAAKLPNPPGTGPGAWQVLFGVVVPAGLALAAAAVAQVRRLEAALWVLAALLATLGLLLLIALLVAHID